MGDHGNSIKKPRMYEALRRKGYSKAKAARISNADANGTLDRHHGGHGGGKMSGSGVAFASKARTGARGGNSRGNSSARIGRGRR